MSYKYYRDNENHTEGNEAMTYVAAEPEVFTETKYIDTQGNAHDDRESAIEANFCHDFLDVCTNQVKGYAIDPMAYMDLVKRLVQYNPEMVRVLLGDRDAT